MSANHESRWAHTLRNGLKICFVLCAAAAVLVALLVILAGQRQQAWWPLVICMLATATVGFTYCLQIMLHKLRRPSDRILAGVVACFLLTPVLMVLLGGWQVFAWSIGLAAVVLLIATLRRAPSDDMVVD